MSTFRKNTFTGQYTNAESFAPWHRKTAWILSLVNRAKRICSKSKLHTELQIIKQFASWNKYPTKVVNSIIYQGVPGHKCGWKQGVLARGGALRESAWLETASFESRRGSRRRLSRVGVARCGAFRRSSWEPLFRAFWSVVSKDILSGPYFIKF